MEFSAEQIATLVNGCVDGDGSAKVSTFAKIEEGHPGALTFLANPKYSQYIYQTKASVVLVRRDFVPERPVNATLIRVDDPYATLARLLTMVEQAMQVPRTGIEQPAYIASGVTVPDSCYVGAFTYIGKNVNIGENVQIYPQAYIGDGVNIGDGTIIYAGVKLYHHTSIGRNCILHSGVVIGADGFGFAPNADGHYSKIPQIGNVVIEDDVEIGANTTVDRATMGSTVIHRGTKLDNLIQVAHNVRIGCNTVVAAQAGIAGSAQVGDSCMIGGQVGVAGHITVGNGVSIGAQSGIPGNVPDGSCIMGYPAVDARDFKRNAVYVKHLSQLFDRVAKLEKCNK